MIVLKPNVVKGGRAIGLGNNLYLMKGRTHSKGGIDIGKNPKTGLEVENNEVMQISPQGVRVFSAQPILGGISPAQYILGGANPNQVFNAQEQWKKVNKINDDGTKKAQLGKELYKKKHNVSLIDDRPEPEAPLNYDEIKRRQEFMESEFNSKAYNKYSGAKGRFQIRENALQDYINAGGERGDLFDSDYNEKVRDWIMENLSKSSMIVAGNPTDSVKMAKQLAAYNWGRGNLSKFLQKQKAAGIDIYTNMGWINSLPKETRDYVNFSLRNQDINSAKNNERYNSLIKKYGGRKIAQDGTEKKNYLGKIADIVKKIIPTKTLKDIAQIARNSQFGDSFTSQQALIDIDPGNNFLLDEKRQEEEFKKLGYKKTGYNDYGLVKSAVNELKKDINKNVPVYQFGNDDASRDTLEVIFNGINGHNSSIPDAGALVHAKSYPFAIYKAKNTNKYFIKSWDLNDYGNHGNRNGTKYKGIRQQLANIYDKIGTPFVRTSGFKHLEEWDGKAIDKNHLDLSRDNFKNDPVYKKLIESIEENRKYFGNEYTNKAIEDLYNSFKNESLKNGIIPLDKHKYTYKYGGIHIKPSKRGTFTAAAKKHGMSVQGFASKVLANKGKYSSAMVKKANFARNASKWKHKEFGGDMDFNYWITKDNIYKLGGRKKGQWGLQDYSNSFKVNLQPFNPSPVTSTNVNNNLSLGIPNLIGAGLNLAGNVASYFVNRRALKSMQPPVAPSAPTPLRAENLETRVSTAAQEAALRENIAKQENLIAGNLSSSRSRLNAVNTVRNQGIGLYNQLQERKQNVQTELINRAKLNRQQINTQNTLLANQYKDKVTNWKNSVIDFENKRKDALSENVVQHLIQGPIDAIAGERGFFANLQSNDRYRMTAFLQAITSPDALKAMNSNEIRQLAQKFGVRTSWLRSIGINV